MRQKLLREGADELSYEVRGIVRKAEQLENLVTGCVGKT